MIALSTQVTQFSITQGEGATELIPVELFRLAFAKSCTSSGVCVLCATYTINNSCMKKRVVLRLTQMKCVRGQFHPTPDSLFYLPKDGVN